MVLSPNLVSFLTVVVVAIVIAAVFHLVSRRLIVASVGAGVLSSLAVHVLWTFQQGYFDGWFFISFFTVSALAIGISFVVGLAVRAGSTGEAT